MKKLFFFISSFCALQVNAQNYLVSFAGTGGSTTVSTVKVENLTKGTSLTMNGSDVLSLSGTTGLSEVDINKSTELKIYPNPISDKSTLEVLPPVAGDAIISVCDITGKLVTQIKSYLENHTQKFILSGLQNGLYVINVKGSTYQISGKLLSNGKSTGIASIENIGNNIQTVDEKEFKPVTKGTRATVDMAYTTGDILKFTALSGSYSTIITDIPSANNTVTFNFISCTDGDNNNYPVVQVGTQVWMAENLKTTKFNDGTSITNGTDNTTWNAIVSSPGYCWYSYNAATFKAIYGGYYNWYTVDATSNGGKNVCPVGWHVPADSEWTILMTYLGGLSVAGGKLKEVGTSLWAAPNTGADNSSGFTARPGTRNLGVGWGIPYYSSFYWSVTLYTLTNPWLYRMNNNSAIVTRLADVGREAGCSIRCVKD
jgi:uncharacterized protein (TIGR02145 family)